MPNQRGTMIYAFQRKFQSIFGFTLPLFHGRGLFNCVFLFASFPSVLPILSGWRGIDGLPTTDHRRPWVAVFLYFDWGFMLTFYVSVGKPIHVERCEKPTLEEQTRVQQRYIEELTRFVSIFPPLLGWNWREWGRIWNTYKDTFARHVWGSWIL